MVCVVLFCNIWKGYYLSTCKMNIIVGKIRKNNYFLETIDIIFAWY